MSGILFLIIDLQTSHAQCSSFCPPPFAKAGDIKTHSSVSLSVRLSVSSSVTKTLTWLISFEVLMIEHWYLACMILVTSPFYWYHAMTLTLTFDLLQGQIFCRAGHHNSSNLLVVLKFYPFFCELIRRINFCLVYKQVLSGGSLKISRMWSDWYNVVWCFRNIFLMSGSTNGTRVDLSFLVLSSNNFSLSILSTLWSWDSISFPL